MEDLNAMSKEELYECMAAYEVYKEEKERDMEYVIKNTIQEIWG